MLGFPGIFDVLLLIALGIGYVVIYFAKREEKELQFLGYIIGGLIIVLATVYLIGNIWIATKIYPTKILCHKKWMQKGMMQPGMMPQTMPKLPSRRP